MKMEGPTDDNASRIVSAPFGKTIASRMHSFSSLLDRADILTRSLEELRKEKIAEKVYDIQEMKLLQVSIENFKKEIAKHERFYNSVSAQTSEDEFDHYFKVLNALIAGEKRRWGIPEEEARPEGMVVEFPKLKKDG